MHSVHNPKTDLDVLKHNHRFLWDDDTGEAKESLSNDEKWVLRLGGSVPRGCHTRSPRGRVHGRRWQRRLAKKYYDKLFKEYALADFSRYKEGKVGFRWRTEQEVSAAVA